MNIPYLKVLDQMPRYVRFMNELVMKKRAVSFEDVGELHHYSVVTSKSLAQRKGDPRVFTITCTIVHPGLTKRYVTWMPALI